MEKHHKLGLVLFLFPLIWFAIPRRSLTFPTVPSGVTKTSVRTLECTARTELYTEFTSH